MKRFFRKSNCQRGAVSVSEAMILSVVTLTALGSIELVGSETEYNWQLTNDYITCALAGGTVSTGDGPDCLGMWEVDPLD